MKPEGLKFTLLGQGDNILQGIEFAVHEMEMVRPSPSEVQGIEALNATIMKSLIREYSSFGLTVKRAETWSHYQTSIYGKDIRADGRVLPMSLKRIARGSFSNNESFGTCDNMLSSISSADAAAIAYSATPVIAACVVQVESMITLSICMWGGWFVGWSPRIGKWNQKPLECMAWWVSECKFSRWSEKISRRDCHVCFPK